jgi:AcrR family transcriptional regulator
MAVRRRKTVQAVVDPRPARREARFQGILAAAWQVADEQGLAGLSLHEVARRVGLRQPSLYAYIDSKAELYDAMFAQAAKALNDHMSVQTYADDPREAVRDACAALYAYMAGHLAASQLLFERTIPGFEPRPATYAFAVEFQDTMVARLVAAGVKDPTHVDIFTAMVGGLIRQQQTNEPGGDRWTRHLDSVLAMFFDFTDGRSRDSGPATRAPV